MDLRAVQAHQEAGGTDRTFQELDDREISSQEDYAAKGGDVARGIYGRIHSKTVKICLFKKPIRK